MYMKLTKKFEHWGKFVAKRLGMLVGLVKTFSKIIDIPDDIVTTIKICIKENTKTIFVN